MAKGVIGLPQTDEGMSLGAGIRIAGIALSRHLPMLHSLGEIPVLEDLVAQAQVSG